MLTDQSCEGLAPPSGQTTVVQICVNLMNIMQYGILDLKSQEIIILFYC